MSTEFETCAWCPRLCRHVCPVAVATGREAATPTSMMTIALLAARGTVGADLARASASLCLSCGACTTHCKVHVPVAERLGRPAPPTSALAAANPSGLVFQVCGSAALPGPHQLACCGRRDGFPEREPEAARQVAEENVRRLGGRPVFCADAACAAWLRGHGADVIEPGSDDVAE